jgi:hypothetical protein
VSGWLKACLLLGGVFALAALAWMAFLPAVVERELRSVTGFDVRVTTLAANPFTGRVVVEGLVANNPPGYPVPDFIELRGVRADIDEFSWIFSDRLVIRELDLDAAKVELVLQGNGRSNAADFAAGFSRPGGAAAAPAVPAPAKPMKYLVRRLHIRLDRLVVADFSGSRKEEKTYDLKIDHTFSDVSNPSQLLVPDVIRSLYPFGADRDMGRLLPGDFGRDLGDALGGAHQVGSKLKDAGKKAGDYLKGFWDKLEQSAKP